MRDYVIEGLPWFTETPPTFRTTGSTPAQKRGLLFEKRVAKAFNAMSFGNNEVKHTGKWLSFRTNAGLKFRQIDWFCLLDEDKILLVEFKLKATPSAVKQIEEYARLLALLYPSRRICKVICCKYLDPFYLVGEILPVISFKDSPGIKLYQWQPRP